MACVTGLDPAVIERWDPREMATAEDCIAHVYGNGDSGSGGRGGGLRRRPGAFGNV